MYVYMYINIYICIYIYICIDIYTYIHIYPAGALRVEAVRARGSSSEARQLWVPPLLHPA